MRTLYLHIGHPKTGSSYLQSCLALSRGALRARKIAYPRVSGFARAEAGGITSGNGRMLNAGLKRPFAGRTLALWLRTRRGACLFSSEDLFFTLSSARWDGRLAAFRRAAGFDRVEMLLFIRDPLDHLPSLYQQRVKRDGETGDVDANTRRYDYPLRVKRLLLAASTDPSCRVTVRNYSRHREHIATTAETWLGLRAGALDRPRNAVVNRSLSGEELNLMRRLNEKHGAAAALVSSYLCERLPDIAGRNQEVSRAAAHGMAKRFRPALDWINERIDAEERYRLRPQDAPVEPKPADSDAPLSDAQRRVIAAALKKLGLSWP